MELRNGAVIKVKDILEDGVVTECNVVGIAKRSYPSERVISYIIKPTLSIGSYECYVIGTSKIVEVVVK